MTITLPAWCKREVVVPVSRPGLDTCMEHIDAVLDEEPVAMPEPIPVDPESHCLIGRFPHGVDPALEEEE